MSLDLRLVPAIKRKSFLQQSLEELNRRLRRRMVTRGDVSLDVEDNRGSYDWPTLGDITHDVLKYSIHFPLEPECSVWPGWYGTDDGSTLSEGEKSKPGVMRVLNIVSGSCRILASRERCPFLVHCEVADTNYEGSDARLYGSGTKGMGATIEEVMGMVSNAKMVGSNSRIRNKRGFSSYRIPSELLLDSPINNSSQNSRKIKSNHDNDATDTANVMRGGYQYQSDGSFYPPGDPSYSEYPSPYDSVREEQLQQLHEHLQTQQNHPHYGPPPPSNSVEQNQGQ